MTDQPSTPTIRLIILDVDGTLVGSEREISPTVHKALSDVRDQGIQIALCTGRPLFATRRFIEELLLPGFHIFDAGAYIADPLNGLTLYRQGLDQALAQQILAYGREVKLHLEVYVDDKYYVESMSPHAEIHTGVMEQEPILADLAEIVARRPIIKMEVVTLTDDENERLKALAMRFADQIDVGWATAPGTSALFCNILAKGVSKGVGAERLIEHLGIPPEQIMGVGDGLNDEPMLRAVGIPIAMGDSPEELKQAATWVTGTVEEDGLALAIERFIPSIERDESHES